MLAKLCVLHEVRVCEQRRPLTVGEPRLEAIDIVFGRGRLLEPGVEQEEMIIRLVDVLVVAVVVRQSAEVLLGQGQVVQLVLEDDASVMQTVLQQQVAGGKLFGREGYLSQVVLPLMRVVLGAVGHLLQRVLGQFCRLDGVALLVGQFLLVDTRANAADDGLVVALPVVGILALAPESFKL